MSKRRSGALACGRGELPPILRRNGQSVLLGFALSAVLCVGFLEPRPAHAQNAARGSRSEGGGIIQSENAPVRFVTLTLNKSRNFRIDRPFSSAIVGAPDILDALPMTDRTLYLQAKNLGTTNVSVFDQTMRLIGIIDVEVTPDTGNVEQKIRATTGAHGIRVSSDNGQVVLSGEVVDAVTADRAVSLAKSLNPKIEVVNSMTVASPQQVMLKVRFLEVARSAARALGVNWFSGNKGGTRGVNTGNGSSVIGTPTCNTVNCIPGPILRPPTTGVDGQGNGVGGAGIPLFQSLGAFAGTLATSAPFGVALASLVNSGTTVDLMISALETKGLIRNLAEPDLVALSGDTASFLAGGQFPIPAVQSSSGTIPTIAVDYKNFGVQLTFMPTVLRNGIINLRLTPSVSELDYANAVVVSGFVIPALATREAHTTIELRDGQSFAIAGMLQTNNRNDINQLPWIGSVPVLGSLFGSKAYQKNETDLVVIVTPHLVAPAVPGQQLATPFDQKLPAHDVDFFLYGRMEVSKEYKDYVTQGGGVQGPYGHMVGANAPSGGYIIGPPPPVGPR
jgi:pilus assembly protein CpaC